MKIYSNIPITQVQRWKEGQFLIAINHKDNGESVDSGQRYEADCTVVVGNEEEATLYAFTRMFHDPVFDQKVTDTIEVDGMQAIKIKKEYSDQLPLILSKDVLLNDSLIKSSDVITSDTVPVDQIISELAGNVKNYLVDLSAGKRTEAVNSEVQQLIEDGNTVITEA